MQSEWGKERDKRTEIKNRERETKRYKQQAYNVLSLFTITDGQRRNGDVIPERTDANHQPGRVDASDRRIRNSQFDDVTGGGSDDEWNSRIDCRYEKLALEFAEFD